MVCKRDPECFILIILLCLSFPIFLFSVNLDEVWLIICVALFYTASILYILWADGRETIMDERGCTVKLLFIKRFYAWEELTTKRIVENEHLLCGGGEYVRCVVFTKKKKFRAPTVFAMSMRTLIPRPLSYIVIGIGPADRLMKCTNNIDEEIFYEKMKEWGVVLEKPIPYYKTNPPV